MPRITPTASPTTFLKDDFSRLFRSTNTFRPDPISLRVCADLYRALHGEFEVTARPALTINASTGTLQFLGMPITVVPMRNEFNVWYYEWVSSSTSREYRRVPDADEQAPTSEYLRGFGSSTRRYQAQPIDESVTEVDFD